MAFQKHLTHHLITEGLHYCCEWAFFELYKDRHLIAARLGVSPNSLKIYLTRHRRCEHTCEGRSNCLRPHIKEIRLYLKDLREDLNSVSSSSEESPSLHRLR